MSSQTEYITKGSSQFSVVVDLLQDNSGTNPGDPLTGLAYNSTNLSCYYKSGGTGTVTQLTLATQTSSGSFSLGGFAQLSSANMPGAYRLDLSTTLFSSSDNFGQVTLAGYADLAPHSVKIKFTDLDFYSSIATELSTYGVSTHTSTDIQDLLPTNMSSLVISTNGIVDSNLESVIDSTGVADNISDQFDGTTGLSGDTFPATQAQVGNLATGSAAISTVAESYVLTTGTQSSGTYTDTETQDGVPHQHTDTAGTMELYYQFDVGGNGTASNANIWGYLTGGNDTLGVYAYDWVGAAWDQIGTLSGGAATNASQTWSLLTRHTGTGANLGKVRLRFYATTLTTATLSIDQVSLAYAIVAQSVGYDGGQVWVDTNNGTAGTESFVNGVADNAVDTLADALTIASNLGLTEFHIANGSSITLAATTSNKVFRGHEWTLALGGQNIANTMFLDAEVTGTGTGSDAEFMDGTIGNVTMGPSQYYNTIFTGTFTVGSAGDFLFKNCASGIAGATAPVFDMGAAVGATTMEFRHWSGGVTLNNLAAGDVITLEGVFGTITLNGADAQVEIRGIAKAVTNNLTGSPTVNDNTIKSTVADAIQAKTDQLTFTKANELDSNVQSVNDVTITGDGSGTPFNV